MSVGNKQTIANNIRYYLDKKGMNPRQLSIALDLKYTTVLDWVNARTYPRIDKIEMMANFFNILKSDLVEERNPTQDTNTPNINALTSTVKDLEESRVLNVLDYAKAQLEEQEKALLLTVEEPATLYTVQGVTKAAAGLGYGFDDYDTYTVYTDEEPPHYDLSTMVKGDSMEPDYQDGDMLYLRDTGVKNFSGELCVVAVNDKTYFKKVYLTSDGLRLVSLNPAYEDIYIDFPPTDNDTHIKVFTVIGSFVPVKP